MNVAKWYYVERWLYLHHIPILPALIKGLIRVLWAAVLPYQAQIGKNVQFAYQGLGVIIHKNAVIGDNCYVRQHVTIGGGGGVEGVPVIGNNVSIGAGAMVIGGIKIGNNVTIGANAVVNRDLPDNCVAVGVPAKPVKFVE